jgi:hypothetical protein
MDAVIKFNVNRLSQVTSQVIYLNAVSLSYPGPEMAVAEIILAAIRGIRENCVAGSSRVSAENARPAQLPLLKNILFRPRNKI